VRTTLAVVSSPGFDLNLCFIVGFGPMQVHALLDQVRLTQFHLLQISNNLFDLPYSS
jgi:hypothetical protein